jgi:hypothetical protein
MLQSSPMASCPDCGSPIRPARTREGERIPLETFTEITGADRYVIVAVNPRTDRDPDLVVARVAAQSSVMAYPDHRTDCPAHGNARR